MTYISTLMLVAVLIVLILGLYNMLKSGSPSRSQNLMRARIVLQFIAVVILMAALYFGKK
jgi:Hypoxia induced protein conserved region